MSSIKKELYYVFMGPEEKLRKAVKGTLNGIANGQLVLTDKKLFFYFTSNISSDQEFIATYPFLKEANLQEGMFFSTINIATKKDSFTISKINKKEARKIHKLLEDIINKNN